MDLSFGPGKRFLKVCKRELRYRSLSPVTLYLPPWVLPIPYPGVKRRISGVRGP